MHKLSSARLRGVQPAEAASTSSSHLAVPPKIHPLEWILVGICALNLALLPWAYGGMIIWSQYVAMALGFVSLVVATLPRLERIPSTGVLIHREMGWSKLRGLSIFWLGVALEVYLAIQALNPGFEYAQDSAHWWLTPLHHASWLPSGMRVPFADMNGERTMLLFGTPWLTACALWIGITRRRSILFLLRSIVINAFLFAVFALLQRASRATGIYGGARISSTFLGAIIYKNHAAAYFGLCLLIGIVVTREAWRYGGDRVAGNKTIVLGFFSAIIAVALLLSYSLAGVAVFGSAAVAATLIVFGKAIRQRLRHRGVLPAFVVGSLFAVALAGILLAIGSVDFQQRLMQKLSGGGAYSVRSRLIAAKCGLRMFADRWWYGWGGGCFRYGFVKYQRTEPAIYMFNALVLRWENIHDDWLEALIELGVAGGSIVLAMVSTCLATIWKWRLWRHRLLVPALLATLVTPLYAFFDFPFHNPAVALTYVSLFVLAVRWAQIEARV